jgi:hypothetical protein
MQIKMFQMTLEPSFIDVNSINMRMTIKTNGDVIEQTYAVANDHFESLFDHMIKASGQSIRNFIDEKKKEEKSRKEAETKLITLGFEATQQQQTETEFLD